MCYYADINQALIRRIIFHVNISFHDSSRLPSFLYVVTRSFSKKLFLFHLVVASNFLQESDQQFGRKFLQRTFKVAALPYSIYSRPIWNFISNIFLQIKSVYKNAVKSDSNLNLLFSVHLLVNDLWWGHQIKLRIYECCFHHFFSNICCAFFICSKLRNTIGKKRWK